VTVAIFYLDINYLDCSIGYKHWRAADLAFTIAIRPVNANQTERFGFFSISTD
jgi:hypothetical protein